MRITNSACFSCKDQQGVGTDRFCSSCRHDLKCFKLQEICPVHMCCEICTYMDIIYYEMLGNCYKDKKHELFERFSSLYEIQKAICASNAYINDFHKIGKTCIASGEMRGSNYKYTCASCDKPFDIQDKETLYCDDCFEKLYLDERNEDNPLRK